MFNVSPHAVFAFALLVDDIVVLTVAAPVAATVSLPFNNSKDASPVCKFVVMLFILYVRSFICNSSARL